MIEIVQRSLFDYNALDIETRIFVQEKAAAIQARLKRTVNDVIAIGQDLIEVKDRLPHGQFLPWLHAEFELSERTAQNFMYAARQNLKSADSADLSVSLFHESHAVIGKVVSGEIPTIREAKQEMQAANLVSSPPLEVEENDYQWHYAPKEPVLEVKTSIPFGTMSNDNEWYTPWEYVEAARVLMGGIDLDPASCAFANEAVMAARYYDIETNGFDKPWTGRVWLNPPYGRNGGDSNQDIWSQRLIEQYTAGITTEAVLLVNASVDTKWFHRLFNYPVCLVLGRPKFYKEVPVDTGSTHGSAFVYFGSQNERFVEIFRAFGTVVKRW